MPLEPTVLLSQLKRPGGRGGSAVALRTFPSRIARFAQPQTSLGGTACELLAQMGIDRLYTHQAEAYDRILRGENVIIVTSTASGKTLAYNLPVLESMLGDRRSRALYLFPTKALAQDQLRKIEELPLARQLTCATYDGDTPKPLRATLRRRAHLVLSNPDMLHLAMLPNHGLWADFFACLRYVVIDEAHSYRGIFGSHAGNVFRRLRRICSHYRSDPQFIACSATIANPREMIERLVGLPFQVIDDDGAPSGPKTFVIWRPPKPDLSGEDEGRLSPYTEAARLLAALIRGSVRTIVFVKARRIAELLLRMVRDDLGAKGLGERVLAYRAGYLPGERRAIERALFSGELLGVCATTALEVGVDIGGLEAAVLVGYPGSIASTWQQAGRVGRGIEPSMVFLVPLETTLDQYVARNPAFLFDRPPEPAAIDPENRFVLAGHLLCAASELPLRTGEARLFGEPAPDILELLAEHNLISLSPGQRWHYLPRGSPAAEINLRSASGPGFEIREQKRGELIGTVDGSRAFVHLHPGAIYLHLGETYQVMRLDIEERVAWVEAVDARYYTEPRTHYDVAIGEELARRPLPNAGSPAGKWRAAARTPVDHPGAGAPTGPGGSPRGWVAFGDLIVTHQVVGFSKRWERGGQLISIEPLDLPETRYETSGLWLVLDPEVLAALELAEPRLGALHAAEHAAIALTPFFALCDPLDVGGVSYDPHPELGVPAIFLYDGHPGGVGIAEKAYERLDELLAATAQAIAQCSCSEGCPGCVQSPFCGDNNEPLDKWGAVRLLKAMTE